MSLIQKIKVLSHNTKSEVKKCEWPKKDELYQSTVVVIVALLVLVAWVYLWDKLCGFAVSWLAG